MAKIDLKFLDAHTEHAKISAFKNNSNHIDCVTVLMENDGDTFSINLDVSTAIKFAKTLRTEINKIKGI